MKERRKERKESESCERRGRIRERESAGKRRSCPCRQTASSPRRHCAMSCSQACLAVRPRAAVLLATIIEATACRRRLWEPEERHDQEAASRSRRRRNHRHQTPAAPSPSPSNEAKRKKVTSLPLLEGSSTILAAGASRRKRGDDDGGSYHRCSASPNDARKPLLQPLEDVAAAAGGLRCSCHNLAHSSLGSDCGSFMLSLVLLSVGAAAVASSPCFSFIPDRVPVIACRA